MSSKKISKKFSGSREKFKKHFGKILDFKDDSEKIYKQISKFEKNLEKITVPVLKEKFRKNP
ncbi:hypothetical protein V3G82_14115 [Staphylococcus aureus]